MFENAYTLSKNAEELCGFIYTLLFRKIVLISKLVQSFGGIINPTMIIKDVLRK